MPIVRVSNGVLFKCDLKNMTHLKYIVHNTNNYCIPTFINIIIYLCTNKYLCTLNKYTFVQFKKREKHPWRNVKLANLLKLILFHGCFSRFLNFTKVRNRETHHK